jgi:prefoldin subunit 5
MSYDEALDEYVQELQKQVEKLQKEKDALQLQLSDAHRMLAKLEEGQRHYYL